MINNMNQDNGMQKRMLLMVLIVFVFFVAYEFLILKPQRELREAKIKQEQLNKHKNAPAVTQNSVSNLNVSTPTNNKDMSKSIEQLSNKTIPLNNIVSTITTKHNIIEIDKLGRIAQVVLKDKQYIDENNKQIKLFDKNQLRPLEVRFSDTSVNDEAFNVPVVASSSTLNSTKKIQKLVLTQKLKKTTLTKVFTFYPDGHYDLNVSSTNGKKFFITNGFRPDVLADIQTVHGMYMKLHDGTMELIKDGNLDETKNYTGIKFVSSFDRYYSTVIYNFKTPLSISVIPNKNEDPQAFIHGNNNISFSGYLGPKEFKTLKALDPQLTDVIEYGWFTFIAKPMFIFLQYIHNLIGNWGWTIVIATILIKLILYPLSYKGMVSMQKLKDLSPKIKEIQQKYKDDKQKASMHMMELYKKHGANPMGGCLPIVLQIPIFLAIYRVLLNAIELKGSQWIFWIKDLAAMDPYFVLPILMGISMWLQQKLTPNTMQDEMQRKIFQMLPIVFTFFFLWFPAGLTLYWFVSNSFTIVQQYTTNKMFEKQRAIKK